MLDTRTATASGADRTWHGPARWAVRRRGRDAAPKTPKPAATMRATLSRRPAMATTAAIASSTGMATSPSNATVTAIRADTAEVADQICRTVLETPGSRSPTSTIARSAAARPAAINAATAGASATDAHSTGSTPAAVSNAIAALLTVDGSKHQRADDGQHGGDAASYRPAMRRFRRRSGPRRARSSSGKVGRRFWRCAARSSPCRAGRAATPPRWRA